VKSWALFPRPKNEGLKTKTPYPKKPQIITIKNIRSNGFSSLDRSIGSSINADSPIKICHVSATCQLSKVSKRIRTNRRVTRGHWRHVDQSVDAACPILPQGMLSRLQIASTNQQLTRVVCAMWQSVPLRRNLPGCCGNPHTHPPSITHPQVPWVFWEVPGTLWEVPGVFNKFT
jgi:hypothetical protein